MAANKTLHGSRVYISRASNDPSAQNNVIACFESASWGVDYDHFEPYVLGKVNAAEVVLTGMAPVMVRLSGWRKLDEGPYSEAVGMTKLQNFFDEGNDFTLTFIDRQSEQNVGIVYNCKAVNHAQRVGARGAMNLEVTVVGVRYEDESGQNAENGPVTY